MQFLIVNHWMFKCCCELVIFSIELIQLSDNADICLILLFPFLFLDICYTEGLHLIYLLLSSVAYN
jgi:hypothetical protein